MNQAGNFRQKGAFLLPNALTTGALFAGCFSIISGINGDYAAAAIAIGIAGLLDGLDGRVARLTNTQSDFGVQYDSLSDMVSFGLAPALLAFNWSLKSLSLVSPLAGKLGWLATFVFIACAALRLARFNAQSASQDKTYFQGLSSPAAAGTLAAMIWFCVDNGIAGDSVSWLIWVVTFGLGLLMFSRVRYFSFKTVPAAEKVPIAWVFVLILVLVALALDPPAMLMLLGFAYVASGLVMTLIGRRRSQVRRSILLRRRSGRGLESREPTQDPDHDRD